MSEAWVTLKKGRERSIERRHPWIFSGAIQNRSGQLSEGELVKVLDLNNQFLCQGMYSNGSLSIKVLSFVEVEINGSWFENMIGDSLATRRSVNLPNEVTNAYRLLHGEGDGVPGLIIDVYNDVAVIQPHAEGITQRLDLIVEALKKHGFKNIVHKPVGKKRSKVVLGEVSERTEIIEDGVRYHVDIIAGQKTGFFIDQRENRRLLGELSSGKRVLNVFSYTGGFSMSAANGGATAVVSIDASSHALELAEENAQLNDHASVHRSFKTDALPYLDNLQESFDIIVLDPPAFAKHKSARHAAIQAYRRINQAAMEHLPKGGILMTFSCSQVVDRTMFDNMVLSASINCGRRVQVMHKLRQPADHPVSISHPEGEYLKGLVLRIMDDPR